MSFTSASRQLCLIFWPYPPCCCSPIDRTAQAAGVAHRGLFRAINSERRRSDGISFFG